jgi:hypothetical protein
MSKSGPLRLAKKAETRKAKPGQSAKLPEQLLADLDRNTKIFRDTLIVLDMSVQSIAAAVDDMACGRPVPKVTANGVESVDFNSYIKRFEETLKRMKNEKDAQSAVPKEGGTPLSVVTPSEDEVHIFGGTGGPT